MVLEVCFTFHYKGNSIVNALSSMKCEKLEDYDCILPPMELILTPSDTGRFPSRVPILKGYNSLEYENCDLKFRIGIVKGFKFFMFSLIQDQSLCWKCQLCFQTGR